MAVMIEELQAFANAMDVAEKHRKVLRERYGLTDFQIGTLTLARRKRSNVFGDFRAAVIAAKMRMNKLGSKS